MQTRSGSPQVQPLKQNVLGVRFKAGRDAPAEIHTVCVCFE